MCLSCVPEAGPHDPSEYELEISVSSDQYPAVSHDGNFIAYYHECLEYPEPEDYPTGLYVMRSDGSDRRLLLEGNHFGQSWSPDSQWLVFSSVGTLQIINLEGDSIRTFHGIQDLPLYSPDWSLDGEEILSQLRASGITIQTGEPTRPSLFFRPDIGYTK